MISVPVAAVKNTKIVAVKLFKQVMATHLKKVPTLMIKTQGVFPAG